MAWTNARRVVGFIVRHNDLTMLFLVVLVFAMMILPMPTAVVDTLIGINMGISFIILLMTMYVASALDFSVFPTLLLFTTLFRVGLNITTTRLILLDADAGAIIETFGQFMVGGNFVVGAVVFLILTVVQFLVIAKGAERVAEVGARFTLDAMPGKQMSIDADMRAGAITMDEAKIRRERVQQESSLYGAMDGAMKFVKGDSIAGMFITVINIVGGIGIGVGQMDMSAGEALQRFGILTIGDGLVTQIPSLLISISAGIIITRTGDNTRANLGEQVGDQIFSQPKALALAGGLVASMALIPGFPEPQLVMLGAAVCGMGYVLLRLKKEPEPAEGDKALEKSLAPDASAMRPGKDGDEFAPTVPIILDIAKDLAASLRYQTLNDEMLTLRRALYFDLGVPFPGINIRGNENLSSFSYSLLIYEVPVTRGTLVKDKVLVREKTENLSMLDLDIQKGEELLPGIPSLWVDAHKEDVLQRAGIGTMDHHRILAYHLSLLLTENASEFIGLQETKLLLDQMETKAQDLVRETVRQLPMQKIAEVMQRLVQERISVRNLRAILEALVEWAPKEKDMVILCEQVRCSLKRQISYMYAGELNILPAMLLYPDVEDMIRKAVRQTSSGAFLALDPDDSRAILDALHKEVDVPLARGQRLVLLTSMDIRRYTRRLVEGEFGELPVLSYQELAPEITVQPVGKVKL